MLILKINRGYSNISAARVLLREMDEITSFAKGWMCQNYSRETINGIN